MAALIVGVGAFLVAAAFQSEGGYGGADSFMHYYFAKYAFEQPHLLLDHWGKPLFTLLASPFAQLGFMGVRVFNLCCGLVSAMLAFSTAQKLELKYPLVAGLMALTATLAPVVWLSGLTEPLFGLVFILAIYFGATNKWLWSALVISFIPMVRTEGIIFLPLWIIGLVLMKQYKALPLTITGVLIYSIIGGIAGLGFDWVWAGSPYGSAPVYGSGELLHFWNYREETFGRWYITLFIAGIAYLVLKWKRFTAIHSESITWFLILTAVIGYFMAHSVVWFLGTGSSAGLTRVMVGIIPVGALVAAASFELLQLIPTKKTIYIAYGIMAILGFLQFQGAISGTGHLSIPTKWGVEEVALQELVERVQKKELDHNYIVYYNPIVAFMMDLNPFTTENSREKVINPNAPEQGLPLGTLVFYDNHFGPSEGNLPQLLLDTNSSFAMLDSVPAAFEHRMPNGDWYNVYLYQKVK